VDDDVYLSVERLLLVGKVKTFPSIGGRSGSHLNPFSWPLLGVFEGVTTNQTFALLSLPHATPHATLPHSRTYVCLHAL
jgi:hypothetical protein